MTISIQLDPETERRLDALAAQTGRSKDYYLRELVQRGIGDLEEYYLATQALEHIRKGESKVLSSEEFWRAVED